MLLNIEEADATAHTMRLTFSKPDTATAFKALMLLAGETAPKEIALTVTGAGPLTAVIATSDSLPAGSYTVQACRGLECWEERGVFAHR